MSELVVNATARQDVGKGASRRLRREHDQIPAIVYGGGKDPQSLTLSHSEVLKSLKNDAFYSSILELKVDGKSESVVLKDIQRHPFKPKVTHMDFQRIKAGEKITMSVPLHFLNEDIAPGVKMSGGSISHLTTEVEVRCLPKDLPEFIEVDMGTVELDQTIHLSDLKIAKGVELIALTHGDDTAIASIHEIKAAKADETDESGSSDTATESE